MALVGERDPAVTAHRAIEASIALAGGGITGHWVPSAAAGDGVRDADGVWCVPASPYADTDGALAAITHARTNGVPFLGTCGGYQHAIIEFAREVMGERAATSIELDPGAERPLITALGCALRETTDEVRPVPGSRLAEIWGPGPHTPEYNCGFGLDPQRAEDIARAGLVISAHDGNGEPRAIELPDHRFFIGVAFQPERDALAGSVNPIVSAFFAACAQIERRAPM